MKLRTRWPVVAAIMAAAALSLSAGESELLVFAGVEGPSSLEVADFAALKGASPFVRILNPAEIYTLKGVARVDEEHLATLYNRETKKSVVVSPKEASDEGIKLIQVAGGQGLEGVTATVSFAGEEVELKYQLEGLNMGPRGPEVHSEVKVETMGTASAAALPERISRDTRNSVKRRGIS
mgnify:CR=1 FL=1